jgi:hypothetical protein
MSRLAQKTTSVGAHFAAAKKGASVAADMETLNSELVDAHVIHAGADQLGGVPFLEDEVGIARCRFSLPRRYPEQPRERFGRH